MFVTLWLLCTIEGVKVLFFALYQLQLQLQNIYFKTRQLTKQKSTSNGELFRNGLFCGWEPDNLHEIGVD